MANVVIEIDGLDALKGNVRDAAGNIKQEINQAMSMSVNQIKNDALNMAPFLTGTLRRSIYADIQDGGLTGFVGQDLDIAPYGEYVEFGTGIFAGKSRFKGNIPGVGWRWINGQKPQPYLIPAFEKSRAIVKQFSADAVHRILQRAAGK